MTHVIRRIFMLCLIVAASSVLLVGCANKEAYTPETNESTLAPPAIGEEGVLRVGVDTSRPPLAGPGSGQIIGLDVDIAAAIADELGLKLKVVDVGSDPATALENNVVDIVMGIDNSEMQSRFWLSESYLPTAIALFSLNSNATIPTANSAATFAAQVSSKSAWAVTNEFGADHLTSTNSLADAFSALESGSVQYVAADAIIGMYTAHGRDLPVTIVALLSKPSGYSVGVSASDTELRSSVTDVLAQLQSDGVLGVIETKWLGSPLDLDAIPLTAGATSGTTTTTTTTDTSNTTTTDLDSEESTESDASTESAEPDSSSSITPITSDEIPTD